MRRMPGVHTSLEEELQNACSGAGVTMGWDNGIIPLVGQALTKTKGSDQTLSMEEENHLRPAIGLLIQTFWGKQTPLLKKKGMWEGVVKGSARGSGKVETQRTA